MNPRENLLSMLRRQGYDYAPVDLALCPFLLDSYEKQICSTKDFKDFFQLPWRNIEDGRIAKTDDDVYRDYYNFELKEGTYFDILGIAHEPGSKESMHMTHMRHPLKDLITLDDIRNYPYPDFLHGDYSHQKAQVEAVHEKGLAAVGNMQIIIWESSWYLRSMEQLMMDMVADKDKAAFIIDKVLELNTHRAVQYTKAGCDILFFGDDIGMQSSIMMSVEMYMEWLQPRLAKLISSVKAINPDIIVFYHSCGFVEPIIPHLIEAGIDVLNPVQPECMDFEKLHGLYGDKISFHGTIGTQTTMPFGTPEEVRDLVTKNLSLAGKKGGLFCSPTHLLEPEVPWENILAYIDACKSFDPHSIGG